MCDLIQHKIEAISYWQNTETHHPTCIHCEKDVHWGKGFLIDSLFLCDPCGEKLHPTTTSYRIKKT